ncbi:MAG: ATP-binding protein, partial [Bacteroidota bacterium]
KSYEKELASEKKSIRCVESVLSDIKKKYKLSDDIYFNMLIAVTEAVNNAIIHGNKCDPSKIAYLTIEINGNEITVKVKDQGEGFDIEKIADPRDPENLLKEGGRGVFLIREITDKCCFFVSDKGTEIEMHFKIQ